MVLKLTELFDSYKFSYCNAWISFSFVALKALAFLDFINLTAFSVVFVFLIYAPWYSGTNGSITYIILFIKRLRLTGEAPPLEVALPTPLKRQHGHKPWRVIMITSQRTEHILTAEMLDRSALSQMQFSPRRVAVIRWCVDSHCLHRPPRSTSILVAPVIERRTVSRQWFSPQSDTVIRSYSSITLYPLSKTNNRSATLSSSSPSGTHAIIKLQEYSPITATKDRRSLPLC